MNKLDKLTELNFLEKQNRNRLEDKLKQAEYYGEIEELFDPLTKTLNINVETMQALQNQTLEALEDNTNDLKSVEHQRQSSFLDERAALLTPTLDPPVTLKNDRGKTFAVDNDMFEIFLLMGEQTNKQLELKSVDPNSNKFKINCVDVSLAPNGIKVNGRIYDFFRGFTLFVNNKDVTEKDFRGEGNKIRLFLSDINYNRKKRGY